MLGVQIPSQQVALDVYGKVIIIHDPHELVWSNEKTSWSQWLKEMQLYAKMASNSLQNSNPYLDWLVGGFNPIEKHARQIGSFPQVSRWI